MAFLHVYRAAPGRKAPIIVITASRVDLADDEDDLGAIIVRKPFSIDRIFDLIRRHLDSY